MRGGLCVHVIDPVKFLYYFLSNYCMCACYTFCNVYIIFYAISVFKFITFQKVFKKALELSYHPIRHVTSDINHNAPCLPPPPPQKKKNKKNVCTTTVFSWDDCKIISFC